VKISLILCGFQQIWRRKEITQAWFSVLSGENVGAPDGMGPLFLCLYLSPACATDRSLLCNATFHKCWSYEEKKTKLPFGWPFKWIPHISSTGLDPLSLGLFYQPSSRASAPTSRTDRGVLVPCRGNAWKGLSVDRIQTTTAWSLEWSEKTLTQINPLL